MKNKILNILRENGCISGEKISSMLNISRTAVWKQINNLKKEGYEISSSRKGYTLEAKPDKLIIAEIKYALATKSWGKGEMFLFETIDSTNMEGKRLANAGKPEGTVIISEEQSAGRGRKGREWQSAPLKGLWFSLILRPNISPFKATQLTFVIAIGVVKALQNLFPSEDIKIKWPNDIVYNGKKIAGILTEISSEIERINHLVVGIGVNVNHEENDFENASVDPLRIKATSLKIESGRKINRIKTLQEILKETEKWYNIYIESGFEIITEEWKNNSVTIGKDVIVYTDNEEISGRALDIDEIGALILRDNEGKERKIVAGDVSLRRTDGSYV